MADGSPAPVIMLDDVFEEETEEQAAAVPAMTAPRRNESAISTASTSLYNGDVFEEMAAKDKEEREMGFTGHSQQKPFFGSISPTSRPSNSVHPGPSSSGSVLNSLNSRSSHLLNAYPASGSGNFYAPQFFPQTGLESPSENRTSMFGQIPIVSGGNAHLPANRPQYFATSAILQGPKSPVDVFHNQQRGSKRKADVIDLTADDDEVSSDQQSSGRPSRASSKTPKKPQHKNKGSDSDSDIQLMRSTLPVPRPPSDEIQIDNTPQLLGELRSVVLILQPIEELCCPRPPQSVDNSAAQSSPPPLGVTFRRGQAPNPSQRSLATVGTPKEVVWVISNESGRQFGCLDQRLADTLGPVMGGPPFQAGRVRFQGAVLRKYTDPESKPTILDVAVLIFSTPPLTPKLSKHLVSCSYFLQHPSLNYMGPERYNNPHNPTNGQTAAENTRQRMLRGLAGNSSAPTAWNSGLGSVKPAQSSEEQRRQQIDQVFESMQSGVDLDVIEPDAMVKTKFYPHQNQALAFLVDREKLRPLPERGANEADAYVGLWRLHERQHEQAYWMNEVTEVTVAFSRLRPIVPPQARGSILADDMGLGKTVVVIALIVHTRKTAQEFGQSSILGDKASPFQVFDTHQVHPVNKKSEFSFSNFGALPAGAPAPKSKKRKKTGKREVQRGEAEERRKKRLVCKSRATLIICPLSTVANWESQIREHTDQNPCGQEALRVYVYHGASRTSDPLLLADYDVVLTTFSTLGSEYSKMSRAEDPQTSSDESDVQAVDENGTALNPPSTKPKRRRRKVPENASSPLQHIEWFRIVLDEAHMIKEHTTIQARAACELSAERRTCLTGTPMQNTLNDLFSLVKFLRVEPFTDRAIWNQYIGTVKGSDTLNASRLKLLVRHLTLRRTKDMRDKDGGRLLALPDKKEAIVRLDLDEHERAFYTAYHRQYKDKFVELQKTDTVGKNYASILQELLRLRQICVHIDLVVESEDKVGNGDPLKAIEENGLSKARACALLNLLRDAGPVQCGECGIELAGNESGTVDEDRTAENTDTKGKRKTKKVKEETLEGGLGPEKIIVLTRCLHITCLHCFRKQTCPGYPQEARADTKAVCRQCNKEFAPILEAITLKPSDFTEAAEEVKPSDDSDDESNVILGGPAESLPASAPSRQVEHSTKIKALMADLLPFSQCNPASANFQFGFGARPEEHDLLSTEQVDTPRQNDAVKSIVFSQWTKLLDRIHDGLKELRISSTRLDGAMTRDARNAAMARFRDEQSCEVMLVSLRAGGVGLNLTSASRVYLMEPFWNPAVENQAVDRIHRLGQKRAVKVTRYIIQRSIEEGMLEIQQRKTDLANMSMTSTLSKAQLAERRLQDLKILFK